MESGRGRGVEGRELVSESKSTVYGGENYIEHPRVSVQSSGLAAKPPGTNHWHYGGPDDPRDGPPRGNGLLKQEDSILEGDLNLTAKPRNIQNLSGRMCFGVSLPGSGHTAYVFDIGTSDGQKWKITRRYSDFLELDQKLRQMFGKPTRPFPPLPKKVLVGNQSDKVVEERQKKLTAYLQAVLENKILSSTTEVKRFIEMPTEEDEIPSVFRSTIPRTRDMRHGNAIN